MIEGLNMFLAGSHPLFVFVGKCEPRELPEPGNPLLEIKFDPDIPRST